MSKRLLTQINTAFIAQVALGNVPGWELWNVHGRNADIDDADGLADLWAHGPTVPTMVEPTTDRVHSIVGGAADDDGGTGLTQLRVWGISGGLMTSEDLTMNGAGGVNTVNSYSFINRMKGISYGSGGTNAAAIVATAATDATVSSVIAVGKGESQQSHFALPNNKVGLIANFNFTASAPTGVARVLAELAVKETGVGGFNVEAAYDFLSGSPAIDSDLPLFKLIPASAIVKVRADSDTDNSIASCRYDLLLTTEIPS